MWRQNILFTATDMSSLTTRCLVGIPRNEVEHRYKRLVLLSHTSGCVCSGTGLIRFGRFVTAPKGDAPHSLRKTGLEDMIKDSHRSEAYSKPFGLKKYNRASSRYRSYSSRIKNMNSAEPLHNAGLYAR
ncbi:hypothetical protein TNCV_2293701 [Trichonephila clavipes]|nr:hypothetical protein TNCV_2293701 [Trichonephila clavipes]